MNLSNTIEELSRRILSGYPVILLQTYEELRWENEIAELALEIERGLVTWSVTSGAQPAINRASDTLPTALSFFDQIIEDYPDEHLFLLKDLHLEFDDPHVVRKLRDLIPQLVAQRKTILMMSPVDAVPLELLKDVAVLELPLPGADQIRNLLQTTVVNEQEITVAPDEKQTGHLIKAVLGLTFEEARKALTQSLRGCEEINDEVYAVLVGEKRRMVQGSQLLEFFDLEEGIDDVGGLDGLKEWIHQRAEAFSTDAQEQGVSNPKGVLLAGVQGCGKSLSAKAIARLLGFPLVRMDLGNLLEGARGSSEQNLRDVLQVMETIAPSVLWLEEIDKAFAGFTEEAASDATISRLLGRFLTWLQEHQEPVFVVATANNVASLPPELLRRGRFDELFFVDLPNYDERLEIFRIHISRRGWKPDKFDLPELATTTEGYSGAEIETIVNSAIIESYAAKRMPTQADFDEARERTVPLSVTMEDEIFHLREWARTRCRPATLDNRVIRIMEEEERRGDAPLPEEQEIPKWIQLAEHGQIGPAITEYIRLHDHVQWDRLLNDFEQYTPVAGHYGLVLKADPKIVIWTRLSYDFVEQISGFIAGKRLYLHPVELENYPSDYRLKLPAIETLPEERVDSPVWLPTKMRLLPPNEGSGRLGRVARIKMGKAT